MKSIYRIVLSLAVALTAFGTLLAAVLQCPKCGREHAENAAACAHCGKELARPSAPAAAPAATTSPITRGTIAAEIAAVDRAEDQDRAAHTLLRARNTLALLKIAPDNGVARPAELLRAITDAERNLKEGTDECFGCRGTGKRIYSMMDLKGNLVKQSAAAGTVGCPVCKGEGKLKTIATPTRVTTRMATAKQAHDRWQQSRGWEEFGGVWLPPGVLATLDLQQKAALKVEASSKCSICHGFGSAGCATCKGIGALKCTNSKCTQGLEQCPTCKGKRKIADPSSTRGVERTCSNCGGSGVSACATCAGRALLACAKCESTGSAACKTCSGLGEPPACTKCDGLGLAPCRTCKGSGETRGAKCTTCNGLKQAACSTCNGSGHAKR